MDDLISRAAAIDALHMDTSIIPFEKAREYADATISEIRNRLEKLPSAQPRPRGEWENPTVMAIKWKCSVCKNTAVSLVGESPSYNFCPKCGADMRQRKEEQDATD